MATTTTAIVEGNPSRLFMLPGMASPESDTYCRAVRFDQECVLIPDANSRAKIPLVSTKSYSLSLWKKRNHNLSESDNEDAPRQGRSTSPEDRVVLKVPIPTFRRRSSRSPTRGRSVSASPVIPRTLPPCLVHRAPSTSATSAVPQTRALAPVRRPSLPIYHRRKDELTVPLRECCEGCERITEECLKLGDHWQEKFSRGARRRRSASLDHNDAPSKPYPSLHIRTGSLNITTPPIVDEGSPVIPSRFNPTSSAFTLTVDEVDKRRKSLDLSVDLALNAHIASNASSIPAAAFGSPNGPYGAVHPRYPRNLRAFDREVLSTGSPSSAAEELPDTVDSRHGLRSSPIVEEDEAQLFPLPSPRRSPSGTPSPSASPRISPVPSPNNSTSCLTAVPVASSSRESISSKAGSSQESLLKASLSRKVANGYLAAPSLSTSKGNNSVLPQTSSATPSTSSLLGPPAKITSPNRLKISKPPADNGEAPSPTVPKGPRPLSRSTSLRTNPVSKKGDSPMASSANSSVSSIPLPSPAVTPTSESAPQLDFKPASLTPLRLSTVIPTSAPIPIPSPRTNPPQPPSTPKGPSSPRLHNQKRKHSFTAPFLKASEALREVGADVLKGVSSMSGSGVVGSP